MIGKKEIVAAGLLGLLPAAAGCVPPGYSGGAATDPKGGSRPNSLNEDIYLGELAQASRWQELIAFLEDKRRRGAGLRAWDLYFLCQSYYALKVYNRLLPEIDALQRAIEGGDKRYFGADITVDPHILRAQVYLDMGDYDRALGEASRAFDLLHRDGRDRQNFYRVQLIQILGARGVVYALKGQYADSLRDLQLLEKVDLSLSNLGPEKYTALARIYMANGDFTRALAAVRDPRAEVSQTLTRHYDTTFQEVPKQFILNKCLYETGRSDAARRGYDRLLDHPQIEELGGIYWMVLYDRARIAEAQGDTAAALGFLDRAVGVIEEQRASIDTDAGRIGYVGDKQAVYRRIVSILIGQGRGEEALVCVERSKSRALVDLLAAQRDIRVKSGDPARVQSVMRGLAGAEASLAPAGRAESAETQAKQRGLVVTFKEDLLREDPELASLVVVRSPSLKALQDRLATDEVLLEYYYDDRQLYAFVVTRGGLQCRELPRSGLEEGVQDFRTSVMDPGSTSFRPRARELYGRLIAPVSDLLTHRALTIVPHGVLHYLPFGALASQEGFLIDRCSIRMMPNASLLELMERGGEGRRGSLLVLANPDLGDSRYDLQFAQEEAVSIDKIVPHSRLLLRKEATETYLKERGREFGRLHFASHGVFQPQDPLRSALLLAGDGGNDGLLTVAELYALDLNADLVTLSACETALGEVSSGDDVVGFTRGLLYAGARSIVSSLWKVDDRATRDLMVAFYGNLAGADKREALRRAQLAVKERYGHPYYWAAFQITGNAR